MTKWGNSLTLASDLRRLIVTFFEVNNGKLIKWGKFTNVSE